MKLTGRGCNPSHELSVGCKAGSKGGMSGEMCICKGDLCNGVERMLPQLGTCLIIALIAKYAF